MHAGQPCWLKQACVDTTGVATSSSAGQDCIHPYSFDSLWQRMASHIQTRCIPAYDTTRTDLLGGITYRLAAFQHMTRHVR